MSAHKTGAAVILSLLLPGLGHILLSSRRKGLSLLILDAALVSAFIFSNILLLKFFIAGAYAVSAVSSAVECWAVSRPGQEASITGSPLYIIFMLLVSGFGALPLLWDSASFSRGMKIFWTTAVTVLAVVFLTLVWLFKEELDQLIRSILQAGAHA